MNAIQWLIRGAAAALVAAWALAWSQNRLDAQALKLYGGNYSSDCSNPTAPRHDCGDNNTVLLYSTTQSVVYGKIVQQRRATLIGAPPPAVASELDRLWVAEWRQKQ